MKKKIIILFVFVVKNMTSQTIDTVSMGQNYINDNYYSLSSGSKNIVSRGSWDIAFSADGLGPTSSTVRINGGNGVQCWLFSNDTSQWSSLDTTGFGWNTNELFNADTSWETGAFNSKPPQGEYDLGWGTYNMITHTVDGDRIFILKLSDGSYKKIIITGLSGGTYYFKYADLNGVNEVNTSINKNAYSGKNFAYYSLQNNQALDREPQSTDWDLLFTKYITDLGGGMHYAVTGVLANGNVKVAQVNNVSDVNNVTYWGQNYTSNIGEIGYDWKSFNMTTYQYDIEDSLVYFVEDQTGDIYKLIFTGFGGSATGDFIFTKELVGNVGIYQSMASNNILNLYPNPANEAINITFVSVSEIVELSIFDITGKQVYTEQINAGYGLNQKRISVNSLVKGIYFLNISDSRNKTTKKFIIK
tara:strand:+ start:492 stop:1739 length:1248 start_codon:yes stop_codon:yes gene_type:complete